MAYSNAVYYVDLYGAGVGDGARTAITNVIASNPSGSITRLTKASHGLVNGAIITTSGYTAWLNGDWKIENVNPDYFDLVGATWQATADTDGTVTPFGGSSWADAWTTISTGCSAARLAPGDTIRISKTPDPVSIGNATWTDCPSGGFNPSTVNISSSTNASPIEITTSANHNMSTGDVVLVNAHTTNYTANGNWQITYVSATKFTLDGSVGVGTGGASGTIRKINSKAVVLATAQTQNVVTTEGGWTGAGDTTVSYSTTHAKSGYQGLLCTLDSSPQTSTLQAYRAISSTDFSTKQKLSFWIYNSAAITETTVTAGSFVTGRPYKILTVGDTNFTAIGASANTVGVTFVATGAGTGTGTATGYQWSIALCSDTSGATPVDIFPIPAIPSTSRGVILSIAKTGGGNLGSAIQSVAVYTDHTAPTASSTIRLDNFQACTTNGLQGDSLISKNGSAQGGTEGYYGIQSINGKVVVLDNDTNTLSTAGRGYSGTSETVETFIRSTFKTAMASSSSTAVSTLNDSGTLGNLIAYEFGYEVGTTNQNGETFLDGLNGNGYGFYVYTKSFNSLNLFNLFRYHYAINNSSTSNFNIFDAHNLNNNNYGLYIDSVCYNNYFDIEFACNNNVRGLYINGSSNNIIKNMKIFNTSNDSDGMYIVDRAYNELYDIQVKNSGAYGIITMHSSVISNLITQNNKSGAINIRSNEFSIRNASIFESTEFVGVTGSQGVLWSYDHDQTDGNHWGFFYGGTFNWQTSVVHGSEPGAWKTAITSADRNSNYKAVLPVAEVAGIANTNLTVTAWVKKDHATNIACRLVCYADTALNITEQADTKADDTDWEQLSITLNSDHANPVFKVYLETWYVSGTSNSYIGSITTA